jgi:hypothetical protein
MVAKKPSRPGKAPKKKTAGNSLTDIDELEKEALEKVNKALAAIENAIAIWDASKVKPEDYKMRIDRLRYFHDRLAGWEKRMLMSMAKKEDPASRIELLREFSDICYSYSK